MTRRLPPLSIVVRAANPPFTRCQDRSTKPIGKGTPEQRPKNRRSVKKIGKYTIIDVLGRGAMGTVYLANDPLRGEQVALKVAHEDEHWGAEQSQFYRALFFNEMRATSVLRHPNIIETYDAGFEDKEYYIAMRYMQGAESLDRYCTSGRLLPVEEVAEIVFKCAEALDYAHRKGVIHRDIKPANIIVAPSGDVRLTDFGVALLDHPDLMDTQLLEPVGSPLYASPEVFSDGNITNQSDLFSLGVVLYELLTGVTPFSAHNLAGVMHRVVNDQPKSILDIRPDLPESLERILGRALAKMPSDRYPDALAFAADLSQSFSELHQPMNGLTTEGRVESLRRLSFFNEFKDAEIWELLRWAIWQEFPAGGEIIREGEPDGAFYIVVEGRVSVYKGEQRVVSLEQGECFGEMGYLRQRERSATIVAEQSVSVLKMTAGLIENASLECRAQFQKVFISTLIDRLAETTEKLALVEIGDGC